MGALTFIGTLTFVIVSRDTSHRYRNHPARLVNHACIEHGGAFRVQGPEGRKMLVICRDGFAVQVDY